MKLAILNFSGNVGKTSISKHLLGPKLGARKISIETINSGAQDADEQINAAQYKNLAIELMVVDEDEHIVVDIGSSNVERVITEIRAQNSAGEDFDDYIIPCPPDAKQQVDTINTVAALHKLGVPADRIHVLMNRVTSAESIESDFQSLFMAAGEGAVFKLCPVPVLESGLFSAIQNDPRDMYQLAADETDFKAQIKLTSDRARREELAAAEVNRRMARVTIQNLDQVWSGLALTETAEV